MTNKARAVVDKLLSEYEEDAEATLSAPAESDTVVVRITGENAGGFRKFVEKLAKVCNAGSSRSVGILEPADPEESEAAWDFDGDGSTKIEVVGAGEAQTSEQ